MQGLVLLISAPFFFSKELVLYTFVKAKKGKKKTVLQIGGVRIPNFVLNIKYG